MYLGVDHPLQSKEKQRRKKERKKRERKKAKEGEERTTYISPHAIYTPCVLLTCGQCRPVIVDKKRAKKVAPPCGGVCVSVMPPQGTPCRATPDRNGLKARHAFSINTLFPCPYTPNSSVQALQHPVGTVSHTHAPTPAGSGQPTLSTYCIPTQIPALSNRA